MGDVFTDVTVSGYNANPPSDDGTETEANRVKWATIKSKLDDPLKTAIEEVVTNTGNAFDRVQGGVVATAISYTVTNSNQGKLIKATVSGITITTPSATDVASPFRFYVLNLSSGDITLDGSGSQTVDGAASITIPSGSGAQVETDGTNWFTDGQSFAKTQVTPQGYLTLVTATPIIVSDQTAKTSVFYTPRTGNLLPIPDGTKFNVKEFDELTLSLVSNHVASGIYDVFAALDPADNSTIIIGTGPVWTTVTAGSGARGTGAGTTELFRLKGLFVNTVAITLRNGATTYSIPLKCAVYLGSIFIDGSAGQVSCHVSFGQSRKWGVWNAFNRRPIELICGDATASWAYNTATIRQSRADATNTLATLCGLPEEHIFCNFTEKFGATATGSAALTPDIGIGVNSTTVMSGLRGGFQENGGATNILVQTSPTAAYTILPGIGVNNVNSLELGDTDGTTFFGSESYMRLAARWMG
jgi:hypothetical protein